MAVYSKMLHVEIGRTVCYAFHNRSLDVDNCDHYQEMFGKCGFPVDHATVMMTMHLKFLQILQPLGKQFEGYMTYVTALKV